MLGRILLVIVRVIQGLAFGAEWGGAILMTFEHAPWRKKGLYTGITQAGFPVGLLLANLVFLISVPLGDAVGVAGAVPGPHVLIVVGIYHPAQGRGVPGVRGAQGRGQIAKNPIKESCATTGRTSCARSACGSPRPPATRCRSRS